jgi:hypothetical protein
MRNECVWTGVAFIAKFTLLEKAKENPYIIHSSIALILLVLAVCIHSSQEFNEKIREDIYQLIKYRALNKPQ